MTRVVVTGLGAITAIGNDVPTFWRNLTAGVSGAGPITAFDASEFPVRIACEVKDFDPLAYMDRKLARRTARPGQFALAVARQAVADAGLDFEAEETSRVGIVLNTGGGGMGEIAGGSHRFFEKGPRSLSPFLVPTVMPNSISCLVSIELGVRGPVITSTAACASGNMALWEAHRLLKTGDADVIIAGGVEAIITPLPFAALGRMGALSRRNDDPQRASRPFDAERDGFVFGEGAAALVLETEDHALARGAHIYAELLGGCATGDAYHITAPEPSGDGAARAMRGALRDAGLAPGEVDVIFAHGTSTPLNDAVETKAIKAAFGKHAYRLAVSATKSMVGHALGAAGAISAVAAVLCLRDGIIPPTINYQVPDPVCDLDYVPNVARQQPVQVALVNGFGFGGQNAVVALRRYDNNH